MKKIYQKPAIKTLTWVDAPLMGPGASIVPPEVGAKDGIFVPEEDATQDPNSVPSVWDE